jgi:hypothetical protein
LPLISASGGTVTEVIEGNFVYNVHTFTTVGTTNFIVDRGVSGAEVEFLIVAGGGGGRVGNNGSAGGGAGGLILTSNTIGSATYPIVVGEAGLSHKDNITGGTNGGNSSAFDLVAIGGGISGNASIPGSNGGSGGGNSYYAVDSPTRKGGLALQPSSTPGIGYGAPLTQILGSMLRGGGAGGNQPGANYYDGLTVWGTVYGIGGFPGGNDIGQGGRPNSGDGGGGVGGLAPTPRIGNDAGSGIVIIRYKIRTV